MKILLPLKLLLLFLSASAFAEDLKDNAATENKEALKKIEQHLIAKSAPSIDAETPLAVISDPATEEPNSIEATASYEKAFIKMIVVLFAILVLVVIFFLVFRRFANTKMHQTNHLKSIKILEKRAISPKSMLYLIEIGGQKILLAESQYEIRNVSDLKWIENTKPGI